MYNYLGKFTCDIVHISRKGSIHAKQYSNKQTKFQAALKNNIDKNAETITQQVY